jgi:hypothetical protein
MSIRLCKDCRWAALEEKESGMLGSVLTRAQNLYRRPICGRQANRAPTARNAGVLDLRKRMRERDGLSAGDGFEPSVPL